jgi:hypothetical protein
MPELPPPLDPPTDRLTVFGQLLCDRSPMLRAFRSASTIADLKPLLELEDNFVAVYESAGSVWIVNSLYSLNAYFFAEAASGFFHGDTIGAVAAKAPMDLSWNYEAIADLLALEHLVGDDTLLKGVRPVPQGAILHWNGARLALETFSFDEFLSPVDGPVPERLLDLFQADLEVGAGKRAIVTLSSGLDSRVNLAGLIHLGLRPEVCVMGRSESKDVQIARAIAQEFDLPFNHVRFESRDFVEAALPACRLTNGVKPLHHWHTYLLATKSGYGPADHVITGNNGEHVRAAGFDFGIVARGLDALSRHDGHTVSGRLLAKVWELRTRILLRPEEKARCAPDLGRYYGTARQTRKFMSVMPDASFARQNDAFVLQQRRRGFQACGLKLMSVGFFPYSAYMRKSWVDAGWQLDLRWRLGSRWHRYAVARLCPALLRFPEEKEAHRMLRRQRPLAWAPLVKKAYRLPKPIGYMDYPALLRHKDIIDLLYDRADALEGFMPRALVLDVVDEQVRTGGRGPLFGILTAMAVWRASLLDARRLRGSSTSPDAGGGRA